MIAAIDSQVNTFVGVGTGQRQEFSFEMRDRIDQGFDGILAGPVREVFDGNQVARYPCRSRYRWQGP